MHCRTRVARRQLGQRRGSRCDLDRMLDARLGWRRRCGRLLGRGFRHGWQGRRRADLPEVIASASGAGEQDDQNVGHRRTPRRADRGEARPLLRRNVQIRFVHGVARSLFGRSRSGLCGRWPKDTVAIRARGIANRKLAAHARHLRAHALERCVRVACPCPKPRASCPCARARADCGHRTCPASARVHR